MGKSGNAVGGIVKSHHSSLKNYRTVLWSILQAIVHVQSTIIPPVVLTSNMEARQHSHTAYNEWQVVVIELNSSCPSRSLLTKHSLV